MNISSFTQVALPDIKLFHSHIVGKHKGKEHTHSHDGDLHLTFEAPSGIAFFVSKKAVNDLTQSVQEFLNISAEATIEDRVIQLHKHINTEVLPTIIEKYGNTDKSALLTNIVFNHISAGNEMGHAEKGMKIICGSRLKPNWG